MTCPLESRIMAIFDGAEIAYSRPERDRRDPTNLDFYLPAFDLYVEVKQFHAPRIDAQLASVPQRASALVLVGPKSVEAFARLCRAIARRDGA